MPDSGAMKQIPNGSARLATLAVLRETLLINFLNPVPSTETLRDWFNRAGIPKFKSNQAARRGGGPCFYSIPAVEKFLRQRTIGRME